MHVRPEEGVSALARVEKWVDTHEKRFAGEPFPQLPSLFDVRAVLRLAKQAGELKRRVRRARAECKPFGSLDRIARLLAAKPLPRAKVRR